MEQLMQIAQQVGPEVVLAVIQLTVTGLQEDPQRFEQVVQQIAQMAQGSPQGGQPPQGSPAQGPSENESLFGMG